MKNKCLFLAVMALTVFMYSGYAQNKNQILHNKDNKTIFISDLSKNLSLLIDYSDGCKILQVNIKGENTISQTGVFTAVKTDKEVFSSKMAGIPGTSGGQVSVVQDKAGIRINNIQFGNGLIKESWYFQPGSESVIWTIQREYCSDIQLEDMSFPVWNFSDISVWKGGIFDNGGMVWCKYLRKNDTYGVHTGGVTFWNPDNGNAFRIAPVQENGKYIASKYTQNEAGEFECTQYVTDTELEQRYYQNRFVAGQQNVFAPFEIKKGKTELKLELKYVDYLKEYSRGTLPGIDADAVRELMNTTGRYGVVDNNIIGANGWITNWKCLHEPFFAQTGMALNDPNYTRNFSATLNQERDLAMLENGRVLSRWHGVPGDEIRGTYNMKTGYYEAMWGYTMDSQTGYIINAAEHFNICGDLEWLKSHKVSCEKALDFLIKRDSNGNGIFEMMNSNTSEQRASDWIDIVWASFENSFVNAQMYEALNLWADCEKILGDTGKYNYYKALAKRLKDSFNKPVDEGGFWYPEKKQYIYWRDDDGSLHGDNLLTPINFAAIAFGICDDPERIAAILDQIEARTTAENLFHWPLCFDSFKREEVHGNNWPFPRYENGDIFPTWGYMGVRAYVNYNKEIALKYIHNILEQYNKDGLSSQRYSRTTQEGLGDDILAGINTTITALYRDIYGIRPKWNRMGLEPNLSEELNGTEFNYVLRDTTYRISLKTDKYEMATTYFTVKSKDAFGASFGNNKLLVYPGNKDEQILSVLGNQKQPVILEMVNWKEDDFSWKISSKGKYEFKLTGIGADKDITLYINNKPVSFNKETNGNISFSHNCKNEVVFRISAS